MGVALHLQLVEWLLHRIPLSEIAASPAMIPPFALIVNAASAALIEASAALAERLEADGGDGAARAARAEARSNPEIADQDPRKLLQQVRGW